MPLYAGIAETDITPPIGVWMGGYAGRPTGSTGVRDPLFARAVVLENGAQRLVLVVADLLSLPDDMVQTLRTEIACRHQIEPKDVLLHCTHTHSGPYLGGFAFGGMGEADGAYKDVLTRKLSGVVAQAAEKLRPAVLTYGESPAQIGANRRQTLPNGRTVLGVDYAGPVAPTVQALCLNTLDGRTFGLLFAHACHPTTLGGQNLHFSADWPGAAVAHLKKRFLRDGTNTGIEEDALAICLQGACGDINPLARQDVDAVEQHGKTIADAAHAARWNAHGRLEETLSAAEISLELPVFTPDRKEVETALAHWTEVSEREIKGEISAGRLAFLEGRIAWARWAAALAQNADAPQTVPFSIQHLQLGGVHLLGFPAEMFVAYQREFSRQSFAPVLTLGCTNGCHNYLPTAAEYPRGGYEVAEAWTFYGRPMFAPESERIVRDAVSVLLTDPESQVR